MADAVYSSPAFARNVNDWLGGHATDAERDRFGRVFGDGTVAAATLRGGGERGFQRTCYASLASTATAQQDSGRDSSPLRPKSAYPTRNDTQRAVNSSPLRPGSAHPGSSTPPSPPRPSTVRFRPTSAHPGGLGAHSDDATQQGDHESRETLSPERHGPMRPGTPAVSTPPDGAARARPVSAYPSASQRPTATDSGGADAAAATGLLSSAAKPLTASTSNARPASASWTYTSTSSARRSMDVHSQSPPQRINRSSSSPSSPPALPIQRQAPQQLQEAQQQAQEPVSPAAFSPSGLPPRPKSFHSLQPELEVRAMQQLRQLARDKAASPNAASASHYGRSHAADADGRAASASPTFAATAAAAEVGPSPNVSTYETSYSLWDKQPEIYDQVVEAARSTPVYNRTFTSTYGEMMHRTAANMAAAAAAAERESGDGSSHVQRSKPPLTTYAATNAALHGDIVTNFEVVKDAEYMKWVAKQKIYFGDLMPANGEGAAAVERLLAEAEGDRDRQRELLAGLREMHAAAKPNAYRSVTHEVHRPMVKTEDPELVELVKTHARHKTMGMDYSPEEIRAREAKLRADTEAAFCALSGISPPPAAASPNATGRPGHGGMRPASAPMALKTVSLSFQEGPGDEGDTGRRPSSAMVALRSKVQGTRRLFEGPNVAQEPFQSKPPYRWALGTTRETSYQNSYGAPGVGSKPRRVHSASPARRPKQFTAHTGAIDPLTAIAPIRDAFPISTSFLRMKSWPRAGTVDMTTTNQMQFAPRAEADVRRTMRAAAASNKILKAATHKSTIPLGKNGFDTTPDNVYETAYAREFKPTSVEKLMIVQSDYEGAQSLRKIFTGPTASSGKVAPDMPPDY